MQRVIYVKLSNSGKLLLRELIFSKELSESIKDINLDKISLEAGKKVLYRYTDFGYFFTILSNDTGYLLGYPGEIRLTPITDDELKELRKSLDYGSGAFTFEMHYHTDCDKDGKRLFKNDAPEDYVVTSRFFESVLTTDIKAGTIRNILLEK